jgi:hypothetical protein
MRAVRSTIRFVVLFLVACSPPHAPVATAKASSFITREQAIANAIRIATSSAPEISGAQVPPQNVQAEQTTLSRAMQRITGETQLPEGYGPDAPVWYVTMDGSWANEMSAPGVTVTQVPYHHYFIILDAVTGMSIETALRP